MTREEVERTRIGVAAWLRGDFAPETWWAPDIEFYVAPEDPDSGRVFRGRVEVGEFLTEWLGSLGEVRFELEDVLEGEGGVVACYRTFFPDAHTGIPSFHVITFDDGMVKTIRTFFERGQALGAAGIAG